jgi:hypothetical protein
MMKKVFFALVLLGMVCGAALLALWWSHGLPTEGVHLVVNEHEVNLAELNGWHAAAGGMGALLALAIVAVVLPLALMLGLLLPLLLVLGVVLLVVAAALGAGALALSPLLLPLLLLAWLWRRSRRAGPATGATLDAR